VFKYMCTGTIEERIDQILERKQRLFDELIDDVSVDVGSYLSSEELFGLFGLQGPTQERQEFSSRPPLDPIPARTTGEAGTEAEAINSEDRMTEDFMTTEDKLWRRILRKHTS